MSFMLYCRYDLQDRELEPVIFFFLLNVIIVAYISLWSSRTLLALAYF